jgi:hypothetical protein
MKRFLMILVLGLLWCNSAYAEKIVYSSNDFIIVHYDNPAKSVPGDWDHLYKIVFGAEWWSIYFENIRMPSIAENHCKNLGRNAYLLGQGGEHFSVSRPDGRYVNLDWYSNLGFIKAFTLVRYFCAEDKDEALQSFRKTIGTRKFDGVKKFKSQLEKKGKNLLNDNNIIWVTDDNNTETLWASKIESTVADTPEQKKKDLASMIDKAKDTCKELGFEEGTEKFADCSLKLYSQSVELAAKNNQQVVMGPQSSGSNSVTIYDPRRDSRILMKKAQRMLSGRCTFGIDC